MYSIYHLSNAITVKTISSGLSMQALTGKQKKHGKTNIGVNVFHARNIQCQFER